MDDALAERSPNKLAADCAAILPKLLAEREASTTKRERKHLSSRIRATRMLFGWAKTRAGYSPARAETTALE